MKKGSLEKSKVEDRLADYNPAVIPAALSRWLVAMSVLMSVVLFQLLGA